MQLDVGAEGGEHPAPGGAGRGVRHRAPLQDARVQPCAGQSPHDPVQAPGRGSPFAWRVGTTGPPDACPPVGPGSLGSHGACRRAPAMRALPGRLTGKRRARVRADRLTRTAEPDGGDGRACQVPGGPPGDRAGFQDPGGTALPGRYGRAGAAPACAHGGGCPDATKFGAGGAGSGHTLSTRRPAGHPARAQDSLAAVGQTRPGGFNGPRGPSARFLRCFLHRFPPFPGFPWRKRASVRGTELSSCRSVGRRGHIGQRNQRQRGGPESVTEDTDQSARVRCCPPLRAAIQSPVHLSIDQRTSPPLDPGAGAGDTEPELVVEPARSPSARLLLASRTVL